MYWHKTYKLHIFQFISISPFCSIRPSLCLLFNAWFHFDNFENERNSPHPMLMPKKHDVNNVGHSITIKTAYLSVFLQWASQSLSIQVGLPPWSYPKLEETPSCVHLDCGLNLLTYPVPYISVRVCSMVYGTSALFSLLIQIFPPA